jgi:hypothetical protein
MNITQVINTPYNPLAQNTVQNPLSNNTPIVVRGLLSSSLPMNGSTHYNIAKLLA